MNTDKQRCVAAILILSGVLFASAAAFAGTPVPSGKWSWVFVDQKGRADRPIKIYTYRPRLCDSTCPIQFVLAGTHRNASAYRDYWELLADHYKFMVIAPEFSTQYYPKAAAYNLGDVDGQADRQKWTYMAIEHIFDEMRVDQKDYKIFGHSAGAQFVQRLEIMVPENRASAFAIGNAGWYLMPEWRKDKAGDSYPYSVAGSKVGEAEVRQALAKRTFVLLGEKDNDPDDEQLNKSSGAQKQGASRIDRGETFFKAATSAAADLGVKLNWDLIELPDVAHDGKSVSEAAAAALWKK